MNKCWCFWEKRSILTNILETQMELLRFVSRSMLVDVLFLDIFEYWDLIFLFGKTVMFLFGLGRSWYSVRCCFLRWVAWVSVFTSISYQIVHICYNSGYRSSFSFAWIFEFINGNLPNWLTFLLLFFSFGDNRYGDAFVMNELDLTDFPVVSVCSIRNNELSFRIMG